MAMRLGVVQPGDFLGATRRLDSGEPEFYFGVRESIDALHCLFGGNDHLVISLDAPMETIIRNKGAYSGLPIPKLPQYTLHRLTHEIWARRIVAALRHYRPTHVLLRTGGVVGLHVADYCVRNNIPSLAVLANALDCTKPSFHARAKKFVRLLNSECFFRVANFKHPAVASMINCGLKPGKAITYEFKGARRPDCHPVKSLSGSQPLRLVFASRMAIEKGAEDVLGAAMILLKRGRRVKLTLIGDGPSMTSLRAQAAKLPPDTVEFTGWLSNQAMFDRLLNASFAFAPTHHSFPEGLPMALTEALASRTPTLISDHPIFVSAFVNNQGVVISPQKNAQALANAVIEIADAPERYRQLSETTKDAFTRIEAPMCFSDVLELWRREVLEKYEA